MAEAKAAAEAKAKTESDAVAKAKTDEEAKAAADAKAVAESLAALKILHDQGVLSDEEYMQKQREIINEHTRKTQASLRGDVPLTTAKASLPQEVSPSGATAAATVTALSVTGEKEVSESIPPVAVAAAASVGATAGPEQVTPERTSSQQESQPEYLRVALLPFTAKFPNSNGAIFLEPELEEFSRKFLGRRSGLKLTYSYYQPELGGGPQLNPAMIWKGNLNKLPKKSEIYSIADKLDADLALTFFHTLRTADWTAYDLFSVDVYLFDLAYERMYHGSGHERNYKEVTEHLFEQLVRDRQESTGKGT